MKPNLAGFSVLISDTCIKLRRRMNDVRWNYYGNGSGIYLGSRGNFRFAVGFETCKMKMRLMAGNE